MGGRERERRNGREREREGMGGRERRDGREREKGWEGEREGLGGRERRDGKERVREWLQQTCLKYFCLKISLLFSSLVATAVPYICNGGRVQLKQLIHIHTSTCMNTTPYLHTHMHAPCTTCTRAHKHTHTHTII